MLGYEKQCSLHEKVFGGSVSADFSGRSLLLRVMLAAADETSLCECPRMTRLIMA